MGGSSTPAKTTQTTKVELPAWVNDQAQKNIGLANQIAAKPLQQYQGETVAGFTPDMLSAFDMIKGNIGQTDPMRNQAADLFTKASGGINSLDRSKYMDPYLDEVVSKSLGALDDSRIQSLMGNADNAVKAKAFGGSRSAIVDAVTNAESAKDAGLLSANLRSQAFDKSTAMMQGDLSGYLSSGNALLGAANAQQQSSASDAAALLGVGQGQQAQNQAEIDANVGKFNEARDYDLQRLNVLLSTLGMTPYGQTSTTNGTSTPAQSGTNWGQLALGGLQLASAFSDRNAKTDIEKLGKDPETGLDMYAYRYKNDPKTYPKVVGPMAQDIEKIAPHAVRKIGGKRVIRFAVA